MSSNQPVPPVRQPSVVVLGASAGGLPALRAFLAGLPVGADWSLIVAQHLQTGRESMLAALLQPSTPWPVRPAHDGAALGPGQVLVIPAGQVACIEGRRLRLHPREGDAALGLIDRLFESLASLGPGAVAVVLSGMGHDGTAGLRAVRAQGGLTAAQDLAEAEHPDMPRSAQAGGLAEIVAPAGQLPLRLQAELRRRRRPGAPPGPVQGAPDDDLPSAPTADGAGDALAPILQHLRACGGQGFERYKPSTVRRRVERRMGLHGLRRLSDYEALLQSSPGEVELLFKEMMIGVTNFFRDPALWQALEQQVLPQLLDDPEAAGPARAWCAGCSTGQEAYSLAMAWLDLAAARKAPRALQLFASDLSAGAVARARAGSYKPAELEGVSAARRERYFRPEAGRLRVTQALREPVLFARHDLTVDPPFGRLDLLVCRNVLIYLQADQQQELLRVFHHCLRPGGWLVLGLSESLGQAGELFQPCEGLPHVFLRRETGSPRAVPRLLPPLALPTALRDTAAMSEPESRAPGLVRQAERLVLERFAPATLLVGREGDVVWSCGPTARFLDVADGRSNVNVLALAGPSLRVWLAGALGEALAAGSQGLELRGLRLSDTGASLFVDVTVLPFPGAAGTPGATGLALIVIREVPAPAAAGGSASGAGAEPEIRALNDTVRRLQEELQATSEDFQSANEELQSSNEELTTSREEMQSMNEELQAINAELRAKLDALALEQSDLKNLLDSTQIATLFLDERLNVRRFTEQARQVVNLRDGDAGRPLSDLTTRLGHPGLVERAAEVLRTLVASEEEVPGPDGRWFSVRVLPYRTVDNVIAGVVITFTDTTRADAARRSPRPPA